MRRIILTLSLVIFCQPLFAGEYVVYGATIDRIANTSSNQEVFGIWIKGGTGPCANGYIEFPRSAAGSDEIYNRAFTMALMAYSMKLKIDVHDYAGASCRNAAYIRMYE